MKLAIVDTETTGFYPHAGHEVWEVALLLVDPAEPDSPTVEEVWQLPVHVDRADPMALEVSGWYSRAVQALELPYDGDGNVVADGLTDPDDFAREFTFLTHGAALIGAVPSFDERHLDGLIRRHGACPSWHYQPVDVEVLAVGYLRGLARYAGAWGPRGLDTHGSLAETVEALIERGKAVQHPPWDSHDLTEMMGVAYPTEEERHTAMGDVRWAWRIYREVMGL